MSERLAKLLSGNVGWCIVGLVVLIMLGPTGVSKVVDRMLPPAQVQAVDEARTMLIGLTNSVDAMKFQNQIMLSRQQTIQTRLDEFIRDLKNTKTELSSLERRVSNMYMPSDIIP